jgi:hypothetical protein
MYVNVLDTSYAFLRVLGKLDKLRFLRALGKLDMLCSNTCLNKLHICVLGPCMVGGAQKFHPLLGI